MWHLYILILISKFITPLYASNQLIQLHNNYCPFSILLYLYNKLHLVIVHQTLKLLYFEAIAQHGHVLCKTIIKSLHLINFVSHLTMIIKRYLVSLNGVVPVQCMQMIVLYMHRLEHSTNTIIHNLYQSWIVRYDIWSSWIKSLYIM